MFLLVGTLNSSAYQSNNEVSVMSSEIKIFHNNGIKTFSTKGTEAMDFLREIGEFTVFIQFIDPKTDCLVSADFTFYPDPQHSFSNGWCFLAEHNGVNIQIPSDLQWYADHQSVGTQFIKRHATVLKKGRYENIIIELQISPNIRTWTLDN